MNYSNNDVAAFMPSLTWAPSADTSVTLLGLYQKTKTSPEIQFLSAYGTLYPGPNGEYLDRDTFVGEPGFDRYDVEQRSATLFAEHRFNPIWSMAGTLRSTHADTTYNQAWWAYDNYETGRYNPDGTINRTIYAADKTLDYWAGDVHASADFIVGGVRNQVMFGLAGLDSTYDDDYGYGVQGGPIDPFDPDYTGLAGPVTLTDNPELNVRQEAVYLQDRLTIDQRIFVDLGIRYDWIRSDQQTYDPANPVSSAQDSEPSRSVSILYAAENGLSPYVSYAETFNQEIIGTDARGNPFEPTRGTQYEAGVKYQPPGTSSILTAAVFDITKSNMTVPDPDNPTYSIQIGEAKSRGLELGAQANYRDVSVDAAYTYLDTEDQYGNPLPAVPNHFASLWLGYRPQGVLRGWKGGIGVRYNGESWVEGVTTPSSTLYDAMLGYETDRYDVTLTGSNIADTTYLNACSPVDCFYGQSRTLNLTVTAKF